jgi:hypothetical protein
VETARQTKALKAATVLAVAATIQNSYKLAAVVALARSVTQTDNPKVATEYLQALPELQLLAVAVEVALEVAV